MTTHNQDTARFADELVAALEGRGMTAHVREAGPCPAVVVRLDDGREIVLTDTDTEIAHGLPHPSGVIVWFEDADGDEDHDYLVMNEDALTADTIAGRVRRWVHEAGYSRMTPWADELVAALKSAGYGAGFTTTGGGCAAIGINLGTRVDEAGVHWSREVLVTDDADIPDGSSGAYVGFYDWEDVDPVEVLATDDAVTADFVAAVVVGYLVSRGITSN